MTLHHSASSSHLADQSHAGRGTLLDEVAPDEQVPPGSQSHSTFAGIPFHNPFDISSYPITNPPIFDLTMMLPYLSNDGQPRRRRISISNGQIGQIINHEAFIDDSSSDGGVSQPPPQPSPAPAPAPAQTDFNVEPLFPAGVPPPNHQLIYNNEVIYNPNNGPIPGTSAWKKERLLERNRIAASKCRQRKKQAQLQLQSSISKYEKELDSANAHVKKLDQLLTYYNGLLQNFFATNDPLCLEPLRNFSTMDVDSLVAMDTSKLK